MKKGTKDYLYKTIFRLFLSKHYELVTIKDIEEATGMSRGAVFYYSANKQTLFCDIVDAYFFRAHSLDEKMKDMQDAGMTEQSLYDFIHSYVSVVDSRMVKMAKILNMSRTEASRAYLSFILEAQNYYPSFNEKLKTFFDAELALWEEVLARAQKTGEIKAEVNTEHFARIFRFFYVGLCYHISLIDTGMNLADIEMYFMSIYQFIKK